MRNGQAAFRN
jgi:2-oxoglutarate dehydrogenase E2 component (dihydrolipoamide succinyltransferase)